MIFPLYVAPTSPQFIEYAQQIIAAKQEFPSVPVTAIVNPDSGFGSSAAAFSQTVLTEVEAMQAAGIYVVGYDWTNYCQMNVAYVKGVQDNPYTTLNDIELNISDYSSYYHLNGIFFDGMTSGYDVFHGVEDNGACAPFYANLVTYTHELGMQYTFGNPGADTTENYAGIMNAIFIYEGSFAPAVTQTVTSGNNTLTSTWHSQVPKQELGYIGFNQPTLSQSYIQATSQYIGWIYMTNDDGCSWAGASPVYNAVGYMTGCTNTSAYPNGGPPINPYTTLPGYLSSEMAALESVD